MNLFDIIHKWANMSSSQLRLQCGELTAQEIRSIKAVLNAMLKENIQNDN